MWSCICCRAIILRAMSSRSSEVTGRVVPTGGLPLDVGAVVCNVSTLTNIAAALDGKKVTEKASRSVAR